MSDEERTMSRGEANEGREALQDALVARFTAALEGTESLELAQARMGFGQWNVYAFGPWQPPRQQPSRIIEVGDWALIHTVVVMDNVMCPNVTGFGAKIQLKYFTSNMQTMSAVPDLTRNRCIQTNYMQCYYHDFWWFRPTQAACLYETNICARICRCDGTGVPEYGGFVRWVYDYDPEILVPGPDVPAGALRRFDHPIRFAVFDPRDPCCPEAD